MASWAEWNFGKKGRHKKWRCFDWKFLAVAVREKLALIQVAAKVCLFSGLGSICLWNLIGEKFIFDPGIPPGEFF